LRPLLFFGWPFRITPSPFDTEERPNPHSIPSVITLMSLPASAFLLVCLLLLNQGAGQQGAGQPSISSSQKPGAPSVVTPHLAVTTSASAASVSPGAQVSLLVDVSPKPKMHVYAPGEKDVIPVTLMLEPDDSYKAAKPEFPKAEQYFFEQLKLTQLVYSKPFRIAQSVSLAATPAARERARAAGGSITIKGSLRYQACDDKVCYPPKTVPLAWMVALK
jgi:Thiol:disulfide interchange protein DsbD, N-terminal